MVCQLTAIWLLETVRRVFLSTCTVISALPYPHLLTSHLQALIENHEFLVEGSEVKLMSFGERVIGVELTRFQDYQVMSINEKSMAKLDCGAVVHVPPFIQQGMMIRVNTHDATFSERA